MTIDVQTLALRLARLTRLQHAADDLLFALRAIYLTSQEPATRAVAKDAIEHATGETLQ